MYTSSPRTIPLKLKLLFTISGDPVNRWGRYPVSHISSYTSDSTRSDRMTSSVASIRHGLSDPVSSPMYSLVLAARAPLALTASSRSIAFKFCRPLRLSATGF